ncbi:MAG: TolC family protein, partial [Deltaproteobacteria bacterium]|nr:TolC family protein [Deltaproteobacteria bacterium]
EVTDSWLRGIEYRDSVDIVDETMQLAAENFILADKRYKAGLNDMIEYNDAQLSLTRSQSSLVTAYYDYLTALARIENAIGVVPGLTLQETK